jgi:hypothetical protein
MLPDWMTEFEKTYSNLPDSTFFIHQSSSNWLPATHQANPHPTLLNLDTIPSENFFWKAEGIRTHSCVSSHMLSLFWAEQGFLYESNSVRFLDNKIQPQKTAWGIWDLPIFYMDNIDLCYPLNWASSTHTPLNLDLVLETMDSDAIYVFDFHPLHIALNTTSFDEYQGKKELLRKGENPFDLASDGYGVRVFFESLLAELKVQDISTPRHVIQQQEFGKYIL